MRAAVHVKSARVQRLLYRACVAKAIRHAKANKPHKDRSYTLVCDYGQNMELPVFNKEQPGCSYYYSPLGIYNFGVVNHAHEYPDGSVDAHLHAHVYHEGTDKKGANNVASLLMKTLVSENIVREGEIGGELNVIFDNCTGQNKTTRC